MDKDLLIHEVKEALIAADSNSKPTLVNFWDDEVYWDKIAQIAVDTVMNEVVCNRPKEVKVDG